jgi:hypothetical protein
MGKKLPYTKTCAIIQQLLMDKGNSDIDVTPTTIMYDCRNAEQQIPVILSNVTTQTIKITPRTIIAEVQPVSIETLQDHSFDDQTLQGIDKLNINTENVSEDQYELVRKLLAKNRDIFAWGVNDLGH